MQLDPNPSFRKVIVPWYDSEVACLMVVLFLAGVCLFGVAGLTVAAENPAYSEYIWMPILLVTMSAGGIVSTLARLFKRYRRSVAK